MGSYKRQPKTSRSYHLEVDVENNWAWINMVLRAPRPTNYSFKELRAFSFATPLRSSSIEVSLEHS